MNDNNKDYNKLLLEKLKNEYNEFIEKLLQMPPEDIVERACEKFIKENIIFSCEYDKRTHTEAKTLYELDNPLDEIYEEWLDTEEHLMEDIRYVIDNVARFAVENNQRESKTKEVDYGRE